MTVPFLDLRAAVGECEPELTAALERVRRSGRFVLGPEVAAFELEFADVCGTAHCVAVASGLDALGLTLRAWGVGPGDEVVVPAYTAPATWMAVVSAGARPVGVEVDPRTRDLDASRVPQAITARTRAIVPVHLFGMPADMEAIASVAAEHGLPVLEDAAHAHGARHRGRPAGSLAAAGAFSFYPTKNLGALGDGGAVTTDDAELAERLRELRGAGGREPGDESRLEGLSSRLDEIQAAVLRVKLRRLEAWNRRRGQIAERYLTGLADVHGIDVPSVPDFATAVWHLFVIAADDRDRLRERLGERGVATRVHYDPPPHLTPTFRRAGYKPGDFPVAEELAARALSLPLHPHLDIAQVEEVIRGVRSASGAGSRRSLAAGR